MRTWLGSPSPGAAPNARPRSLRTAALLSMVTLVAAIAVGCGAANAPSPSAAVPTPSAMAAAPK